MVLQYPVKAPRVNRDRVYQYPRSRRRPPRARTATDSQSQPPSAGDPQYVIRGLSARKPEFFAWRALTQLGWDERELRYQTGFNGGRNFKGGFVIDIIVPTRPLPTPVFVNGEYWHDPTTAANQFAQEQKLRELFPGQFAEAVTIWAGQVDNEQLARMTVDRLIGRP